MTGHGGRTRPLHRLSWSANGDRLAVAIAANRLAASGRDVWRCLTDSRAAEAGDYLVAVEQPLAAALGERGISLDTWTHEIPEDACRVPQARIAVLAGRASAYPYYGYYALALACLGHAYTPVDGQGIANGALDGERVVVLPGGFSNWSLDFKEASRGADAALRRFLLAGGVALGSCGGSFYLSRGRPAWLGLADARPVFTQEYLRTGVGVTTCAIAAGPLRLGLPPTLEIPYFHGPVYDELGPGCRPLATFHDLYGHGRLFIDNPLSEETFVRHMQGRVAMLQASGARGSAILFSPHPEMGDLLRKYMALESYVPKYLPVRGELVMRETLATFAPAQSRSFLLIQNAIEHLLADKAKEAPAALPPKPEGKVAGQIAGSADALAAAWRRRRATLVASEGGLGSLEREIAAGLDARLEPARVSLERRLPALARSGADGARIAGAFAALSDDIRASWQDPPQRRPAELLLEIELAILLVEAWTELADIELLVSSHG